MRIEVTDVEEAMRRRTRGEEEKVRWEAKQEKETRLGEKSIGLPRKSNVAIAGFSPAEARGAQVDARGTVETRSIGRRSW